MTENTADFFDPPPGLRSPHLQSLLNSSGLRGQVVERRAQRLLEAEQEWIMDGGDGVRLLAHYSPQPAEHRGTIALLHGWEGTSRSNYILATGARMFDEGYNVFRLNFRDHGDSHALNEEIFNSCRLDEVINSLGDMQARTDSRHWAVAGFSLGGNFALRVALHGPGRGLNIGRAVAVCPVIDPLNSLLAMEEGPAFYEQYYNRKWARSLRKKQTLFPDRYDYEPWFRLQSMREKTQYFAVGYGGFESLEAYFNGYSVAGDRLKPLQVPCSILTSVDDPVIPYKDFEGLPDIPELEVTATRYGGHCGFIKNWKLESWADDFVARRVLGGSVKQGAWKEQTT